MYLCLSVCPPQVQVVGYLHNWVPSPSKGSSGEFIYYNHNNASGQTMQPLPRSGNLVDGTKTVHAAQVITFVLLLCVCGWVGVVIRVCVGV